jgi:LruC domain-containing protein
MYKLILILILIVTAANLFAAEKKIDRVEVIMERITHDSVTHLFTVWFGYYNPNSVAITIPVGEENYLSVQENMGQTTVFLPGRRVDAFSVTVELPHDDAKGSITWKLRTTGAVPAGFSSATAATSMAFHNVDTDLDGVIDNDDAYPNDHDRSYDTYSPGLNMFGTLAYEDLWPDKGDYDLNDMVLDYNYKMVTNSSNYIKDIYGTFKLRAVGASKVNAFAIEFPFLLSNIDMTQFVSLNGTQPYTMTFTDVSPYCILTVINSTNELITVPGNGVYWNTQMDQPKFPEVNLSFRITFINPINPNLMPYSAPFNPFIIADRVAGKEVHLPGMKPTALADPAWFGLGDDDTQVSAGKYYKTRNNLPWAIHIPVSFKYPIERKQITEAYLGFKPWAESGGTSNQNWYLLTPNQIDMNNIYNK